MVKRKRGGTYPIGFHLSAGQAGALDGSDVLLNDWAADLLIADKAYDASDRVMKRLEQQRKTAVIPPKRNRINPREDDKYLYQARHLTLEFLCQTQAGASARDPLRSAFSELSGCDLFGCYGHLASLMTRPSLSARFPTSNDR